MSFCRYIERTRTLPILLTSLGCLGILAVTPVSAADLVPGSALVQEEGVWITIGTDAFARLQAERDLVFLSTPLQVAAQQGEVVATRIAVGDLDRVSQIIHESHTRCPGFLAHDTLEEAQLALQQSARAQLGGTLPYEIDQPALVNTLDGLLQSSEILSTIETLSTDFNNRYYAHPAGQNAAEWIRDLWAGFAASRPEVTVELVNHSGWVQPSVILTIPGSSKPNEIVVLGGHLDSTSFGNSDPDFIAPGADDNASGIATLSEVIRVALAQGFNPQRTVKFMGYAAEEVGLRGSQDIAASFQGGPDDVVGVLQVDMTGFNGSSNDVSFISDFTDNALTAFVGDIIDTHLSDLDWNNSFCGYGCSDHAAWHNRGFRAVFPFEATFGQHNGTIHSPSDTVGTLGNSADHALKFARVASAFMVETSVDIVPPIFVDGFESGDTSAWSLTAP